MKRTYEKGRKVRILMVMFFALILNILVLSNINSNYDNNISNDMDLDAFQNDYSLDTAAADSWTEEWLRNRDFTTPLNWTNTTTGDTSDLNASATDGNANFNILGDKGNFTTYETTPNASGEWLTFQNPEFPSFPIDPTYVEQHGIDDFGWWASHEWLENFDAEFARPSVHWKRNFSIPVDIADYTITDVSLRATVNGTVIKEGAQGGIDITTDSGLKSVLTGDYAKFYVLVSDIDQIEEYQLAYNQTSTLGDDNSPDPTYDYMYETNMTSYSKDILIAFLSSVFARSINFTITLGININCEDNQATDRDTWTEIRITDFCLNFSFEKKMDRYTSLSYSQTGNKIPDLVDATNIEINNGNLSFQYKIDKDWHTDRSPNSELRALINGVPHPIGIKLADINTTYATANLDVTALLSKAVNISTSFQLILLDNFDLNETFVVSIDNVSLMITYSKSGVVTPTTYTLHLNGEDKTTSGLIEIPWGETVNITCSYKRESNGMFLNESDVYLEGYGPTALNLTENLVLEQYNITIDTSILSPGLHPLTLTMDKLWWETQEVVVIIKVLERDADLGIFLNGANRTQEKSIFLTAGNPLNITITLNDSLTHEFIDNASVKIYNGEEWNKTLTENSTWGHYSVNVSTTTELNPGITFLTLLINRDNYSAIGEVITISISVRQSNYSLLLDEVDKTGYPTITKNVNETIDIKFIYRDFLTKDNITSADVNITIVSTEYGLDEQPAGYYNFTIDTNDLNQGINFVTIFAQHPQYSPQAVLVTIEIVQLETNMTLKINGTDKTSQPSYTVTVGDHINITVDYFDDDTQTHISNATIQLLGGGVDGNFTENLTLTQYSIIIDSNNLSSAINYVSVYAHKANYEAQSVTIQINVIDKASSAELYFETINKTSEKYVKIDWNEILNITIIYVDNASQHISDADEVSLSRTGIYKDFTEDVNQYELYLNTTELNVGINFLVILAYKQNYESQSFSVQIEVSRRVAEINKTYLNSFEVSTYETEWNELLNITIKYTDNETDDFLYGVTVKLELEGSVIGILAKDLTYDQYSFILNTSTLDIGLIYLTISAELENYTSVSKVITINVLNRDTEIDVFLDGDNTNTIDIPWNELLNLSIIYNDNETKEFLNGSIVELKWGSTSLGYLIKHPTYDQYNITINTTVLGTGLVFLSVSAKLDNYSLISAVLTISISQRETSFNIFLNDINVTVEQYGEYSLGDVIYFNISYFDTVSTNLISGAELKLKFKGLEIANWTASGQYYLANITIRDLYENEKFIIGVNVLVLEITADNYQAQSLTLNIFINKIRGQITPKNSETLIQILVGQDVTIQVELRNLDFPDEPITNAIVTYTSNIVDENLQTGTLTHKGAGIYEIIITAPPEGVFIIIVSVTFDSAEDIKTYEIINDQFKIDLIVEREESILFQVLTAIFIAAAVGMSVWAVYYQKIGKYPKPVRKVRKTKSMFKKNKFKPMDIIKRKDSFAALYIAAAVDSTKLLKDKFKPKGPQGTALKDKLKNKLSFSQNLPQKPIVPETPPDASKVEDITPKKPEAEKPAVKPEPKPEAKPETKKFDKKPEVKELPKD